MKANIRMHVSKMLILNIKYLFCFIFTQYITIKIFDLTPYKQLSYFNVSVTND
ncbi:hypothetical protein GCM10007852_11350 [Agaribacter marinus]|uniref:Uncharacterized protein n=1 Tax=Agaribacter marinus TaxID=1431249 RepID=A0AA37SVP2_9ALTE|nr:hypothetical protein GCM10007852_11350 [Agaribacter marinus]